MVLLAPQCSSPCRAFATFLHAPSNRSPIFFIKTLLAFIWQLYATITSVTRAIFHTSLRTASTRFSTVVYASLTLQRPPLLLPIETFPLPSRQILAATTVLLSRAVVPLALRSRPATSRHHCRSAAAASRPFIAILTAYILYSAYKFISFLLIYPFLSHPFHSEQHTVVNNPRRAPRAPQRSKALNSLSHYVWALSRTIGPIRPPFYAKLLRCRIPRAQCNSTVQFVHICHLTPISSYQNTQVHFLLSGFKHWILKLNSCIWIFKMTIRCLRRSV